MAATDQTYRKLKTVHIVFGVSCLLMLLSVIWMFVQDFNREYKPIQRKFRDVETQSNLFVMLQQLPRGEELQEKINTAEAARKDYAEEQAKMRDAEKKYSADRQVKTVKFQTIKASVDAAESYYNIAVEDQGSDPDPGRAEYHRKNVEHKLKELTKLRGELADAQHELDQADLDFRDNVTVPLSKMKDAMDAAEDDLKRVTGAFDRFAKATAQKGWKISDTIRALPIIDGFASPEKINQIVLNELPIDYNFKQVPRYDRCATCHLGIDRSMFDRGNLTALTQPQPELEKSLKLAKKLLVERKNKGEELGFDPNDLPEHPETVKMTKGEITMYASHPRLDLFVDSNSPHPMEKFGCTICHAGQGSSTSFTLASHMPTDARQEEEWQKEHDWKHIHDWDYPMFAGRFQEASCLQCHHQVTDLIRYGSKEEAPKLLQGYNLVKENGCFGCHEIAGIKSGRSVGPDLRLEPMPALEYLSAADQEKAKSDPQNPPGTMRRVGPSLRRIAEKTNEKWAREWIHAPRNFRPDTKMPHFYGLANNSPDVLPEEQQKFPGAEIHAIAHYLFAESKGHLGGEDTARKALLDTINTLYTTYEPGKLNDADKEKYDALAKNVLKLTAKKDRDKWVELDSVASGHALTEKERKELAEATRNLANLSLLSEPPAAAEINNAYAELKQLQDRLQELKVQQDDQRRQNPPLPLDDDTKKTLSELLPQVKAATARLVKLGKPIPVKEQVIDVEGKVVPTDTIMKGDADNGKKLFIERGCLACHSHAGTEPTVIGEAVFGPNLSRIAAKLGPDNGNEEAKRRWLVQWLLNPTIHSPRTRMPVTFLKPEQASDIASWLLSQEVKDFDGKDPSSPDNATLVEMARVYLRKAPGMTGGDVDKFLPKSKGADELPPGITGQRLETLSRDADEWVLSGGADKGTVGRDKLLWYIGKKSISRQGCYGCHEIPGFETAKPIGTALNDWGKKDPERLAFEDSEAFLKRHYNIVESRDDAKDKSKPDPKWKAGPVEVDGQTKTLEPYEKYFAEALEHHRREGFLHLKLVEPRSYDYRRLRTWDDRLRMPQFQFSRPRLQKGETDDEYKVRTSREEAEAREAVMTFVLGLLAEPIPLKYVSHLNADREAEVRGRQVLDKFNCAGCHQIRPGVYEFKSNKDVADRLEKSFNRAVGNTDSDKSMPGLKADHYFPNHNAWAGIASPWPDRMQVYGVTPKAEEEEREGNPDAKDKVLSVRLTDALRFTNNQKLVRDIPASSTVKIAERDLLSKADPWGGRFVHLLVGPLDPDDDKKFTGYLAKQLKGSGDDSMARLPPPLIREGERVQTKWLYQFVQNPTPIRPESYMKLRMPRFNMSPEEAQAIVNYFAAAAKMDNPGIGLTYPYEVVPERDPRYLAARAQEYQKEIDNDKGAEERARAELKDAEALLADLNKAEKKDDKAIAAEESKIKDLKDEIDKKKWADVRKRWATPEAYEKDAYKLLTNRNICLKCHSIGDVKVEGASGPPLDLAAERLRPEWTREWISNPMRMFPYNPQMPQNFANDQKDEKTGISKQWLESYYGTPREQVRAVRDALMDLPDLRRRVGPAK